MNRSFCIYPTDLTTEFLSPVYKTLVAHEDIKGISGDSTEDLFFDKLTDALSCSIIHSYFFLGHGCSTALYGNGFSELITADELKSVNDKNLILFSCNSSQLMEKIDAKKGIGFGFIPSGQDDILHSTKFHHLDLSHMQHADWNYLREAYQKIWIRALKYTNDISNTYNLYKNIELFLNKAIVEVLQESNLINRNLIASILFYVKKDMIFFDA